MPSAIDQVKIDTALGNRMLANEGVLDAFGHVSMRHPTNPNRYFLSRSRAPELVEPADVLEYDLDSNPVKSTSEPSGVAGACRLCGSCRVRSGAACLFFSV